MPLKAFSRTIMSMASSLEVVVVLDESQKKKADSVIKSAYAEADRLIGIINAWKEGTELYQVNQLAGIAPLKVCDELFYLVKRSIKISELTGGLFDVTFASIDKVWYFDKPLIEIPTPEKIAGSVKNISYKFIQLDEVNKTIFITNKATKIELGAIGKGYVANKMKLKLISLGIQNGMVNAGGDLTVWGTNQKGEDWRIGVADPNKKEDYIAFIPLHNESLATSGNYERFAIIDGQMYSHIINPKTGYPVRGIKSVTVLSPDVELCDAIATSVFLLGVQEGLSFVNRFGDIKCFIVDDQNTFHYSDNLEQKYYSTANLIHQ